MINDIQTILQVLPSNFNFSKDLKLRINGRYCRKKDYDTTLTCMFSEPTPPIDKHQKPMYVTGHYNTTGHYNKHLDGAKPFPFSMIPNRGNSFIGIRYDDSDKYLNLNTDGELEFMNRNVDNVEEFYSKKLLQKGNDQNIETDYRFCAIDQDTKHIKCFKYIPTDVENNTFVDNGKTYNLIDDIDIIV